MVNIEDAIKTSGLEGKMEVIDLVELIDRHMIIDLEQDAASMVQDTQYMMHEP